MSPNGGGNPSGKIEEAINNAYGSFENFKTEFSKAAGSRFGSGWAWLCYCSGELKICSTPNQDNPLMEGQCGEHLSMFRCMGTYYLNYQNRRPDYIDLLNVINWEEVNRIYENAI